MHEPQHAARGKPKGGMPHGKQSYWLCGSELRGDSASRFSGSHMRPAHKIDAQCYLAREERARPLGLLVE